jgi:hypothetical protein
MNYLKAWAVANLLVAVVVAPVVLHVVFNGKDVAPLEETYEQHWEEYKQSKFY